MRAVDILKPLGVFVVVIAVILAGTAALGYATGGSQPSPEGRQISGQSPTEWRPERVLVTSAAENGTIQLNSDSESKRILVDTRHANQFERDDVEPLVDALVRNGHEVQIDGQSNGEGATGFGQPSYNATLQQFDAVLILAPTSEFTETQVAGLEAFARAGGRVVVLNEPTQNILSSTGLFGASVTTQQYTGQKFTGEFGMRVGDGALYNIEDANNDNNFKSIYATPSQSRGLTRGVSRVTFDTAGRLITTEESDVRSLLTAVDGTVRLGTRRTGEYTVAARNGNVVLVADSSFIEESELYDADNEKFVGNLLEFLVSGDKPEDVPKPTDETGDGTPTPPEPTPPENGDGDQPTPTPPPEPPATPTPTPTATPAQSDN